ncbi:hypothetical protein [Corallococcus llansteffanensis]|uniref:Uncharacterized protein n=1 Tax=Corallococcus llansteffanensis TaxID=2316731 RepID=A0A3A8NHH9_9BACT|nr:hypothetical protein [Corallococcus llansteffanensis]RKH40605.1 hypothetical protein D7V93_39420 [Corallococcus llansteffanensis]
MKTSDIARNPSSSSALGKKAPSTHDFLKRCALTFGTAIWLEMGCAGAPVRPEPGDCPKEAIEAMEELDLWDRYSFAAWLDVGQMYPRREGPDMGVYRSGPIVSFVYRPDRTKLPKGTRLYGQLWVNEKERIVYGRWTEAELPGNRKVPVCLVLAGSGRSEGWEWGEGSAPGAVRLERALMIEAVHHWPAPDDLRR